MRKTQFGDGEYYHLVGRGVYKQKLFLDQHDWARFLFLILYFQSNETLYNISRITSSFIKKGVFGLSTSKKREIIKNRIVHLSAFTFMPNHFHLLVRQETEKGISTYMQRVLTAYAKYFNTKYKKSGHVFQGPFRAVHITTNEQLLHVSAYIHKNQKELSSWKNKGDVYPWSSYIDYVKENRWGDLLDTTIIIEQFESAKKYKDFVESHSAKEDIQIKYD